MRCCALFGIAGLSLDNLLRCAVAHLHYVYAGLYGGAAATVEVVYVCDVRIAHALGSDSFDDRSFLKIKNYPVSRQSNS